MKSKSNKSVFLFTAILISSNWVYSASLPPSNDTFIDLGQSRRNAGNDQRLIIRNAGIPPNQGERYSYISFDLSPLPTDAIVSKATLRLFCDKVRNPGLINLHVVLEPWDELEVTHGTAPAFLPSSFAALSVPAAAENDFLTVDVTSIVELWAGKSTPNNGIALLPDKFSNLYVVFDSKENLKTSHQPELEVVLENPGSSGDLSPVMKEGDNIYYNQGNFGLGTDIPQTKLEVSKGVIRASRHARQYLQISGHESAGGLLEVRSPTSNKKKLRIKSLHEGDHNREAGETGVIFEVGDVDKPIQAMKIAENGKIGIRILKPQQTLDVGGSIGVNGRPIVDRNGQWVGEYAQSSVFSDTIASESIYMNHLHPSFVDTFIQLVKDQVLEETCNDLLLYYSFDANEGNLVPDQSGNGHTGEIHGAKQVPHGILGQAMSFEKGDRIDAGDILDVGVTYPALTVCAWVQIPKTQSGSEMIIVGKNQTPIPYTGWRLGTYRNNVISDLIADWPERSLSISYSTIFDDRWHFVCGVLAASSSSLMTKVYVDGVLEATDKREGPHEPTTTQLADLWIGLRSPASTMPFAGLIDEVRIYGRELTKKEITRLFQLKKKNHPIKDS